VLTALIQRVNKPCDAIEMLEMLFEWEQIILDQLQTCSLLAYLFYAAVTKGTRLLNHEQLPAAKSTRTIHET
jgi:hypothetical protein